MSFRRLKTLIAVAECGSFVKAANSTFLTPAAVSQQMKILEQEMGVALFDRKNRTPSLTPLGSALVSKAREVVQAYENMVSSVTGDGVLEDDLAIGAVPTTMTGLIPRAVKSLRDSYSGLHIRIIPGLSSELYSLVDRGFLDAAVLSEPVRVYEHMRWLPIVDEPLIVLAPDDAPGDDPRELLESYPFIRFNSRAWVGQLIDQWLKSQQLKIREGMELDTLESISAMVFHGLGVSIVPMRCVPSPRPLELKRIPLPATSPRRLGLLSRHDNARFKLIDIVFHELSCVVELSGQLPALSPILLKDVAL
ncbi:MAG: LysR family transcriptional regulator [Gammaproteobacteria bacterium]|nr:LysR family transcriptional regulator [Gammaproteobacteria bacterium]MCZ6578094.1 LysR family transcriptional regulator [Gammaproteobacteria bacterium]